MPDRIHPTYTLEQWLIIIGRLDSLDEYEIALVVFNEQKGKLSAFNRIQIKTQFIGKQVELLRATHNVGKN